MCGRWSATSFQDTDAMEVVGDTEFVTRISSLKRKLLRGRVLPADHRGTGGLFRRFDRWSICGHTRISRQLI